MADNFDAHLKCCVCRDLFVYPRLYSCGHSVCEQCMSNVDKHTTRTSAFHLPIFTCPMCRFKTLIPWFCRQENLALRRIVETHPQYADRLKEHGDREKKEIDVQVVDNVDLDELCTNARVQHAEALYRRLYPLLFLAASQGKQHVIISSLPDVQEIEPIADLFANMLIEKHNIYKVLITRHECTIMFTENAFDVGREYCRDIEENTEEVDFDMDELEVSRHLPLLQLP